MTAEALFVALDGRSILSGKDRHRIEIYSIRDEGGYRWLQLALGSGGRSRLLTLRLRTGDGVEVAMGTLRAWLHDPATAVDVINVA